MQKSQANGLVVSPLTANTSSTLPQFPFSAALFTSKNKTTKEYEMRDDWLKLKMYNTENRWRYGLRTRKCHPHLPSGDVKDPGSRDRPGIGLGHELGSVLGTRAHFVKSCDDLGG